MKAKLKRSLDFLVIADHAEYLGLLPMLRANDPDLMKTKAGKRWAGMIKAGGDQSIKAFYEVLTDIGTVTPRIKSKKIINSAWKVITAAAERHNQPGQFTAFIGYEWTTMPKGQNLHRIVKGYQ